MPGEQGVRERQEQTEVTVILWCLQIHTHTHTLHKHTIRVTGMCPRKAGMPGREEAADS